MANFNFLGRKDLLLLPLCILILQLIIGCADKKIGNWRVIPSKETKILKFTRVSGWTSTVNKMVFNNAETAQTTRGWAVGSSGLILYYNGSKWIDKSIENIENSYLSIAMNADLSKGLIVGSSGIILSFDGKKWVIEKRISPISFYDVTISQDAEQACIVGEAGRIFHRRGSVWSKMITTEESPIKGIRMNEKFTEGRAITEDGKVLHFSKGKWQIENFFEGKKFTRIWFDKKLEKGLIIGEKGALVKYENEKWSEPLSLKVGNLTGMNLDEETGNGLLVGDSCLIIRYNFLANTFKREKKVMKYHLTDVWQCRDLSLGWASGPAGLMLKYQTGEWRLSNGSNLSTIHMSPDFTSGWAGGEFGSLFHYERGSWSKHPTSYQYNINSIKMNSAMTEGWAVGDSGLILSFRNNKWKVESSITKKNINKCWFSNDLTNGWAVGSKGLMLKYHDKKWTVEPKITDVALTDIQLNNQISEGWAVGNSGVLLHYEHSLWRENIQNIWTDFYSISLHNDVKEGWIAGEDGRLFTLINGRIREDIDNQRTYSVRSFAFSSNMRRAWGVGSTGVMYYFDGRHWDDYSITEWTGNLYGIAMNKQFTSGFAVGVDELIQSIEFVQPPKVLLRPNSNVDFKSLVGGFDLKLNHSAKQIALHLIDQNGVNRLQPSDVSISKISDHQYKIDFSPSKGLLANLSERSYDMEIEITYNNPYKNHETHYVIESNLRIGPPIPLYAVLMPYAAVSLLLINFALVSLSGRSKRVRRILLHPVGSNLVGLILGKYLVIDFLIRFVKKYRIGLFRDYRQNLKNAPFIKKWNEENSLSGYIKPEVSIVNSTQGEIQQNDYESILDYILGDEAHKNQLWTLIGSSGLGKSALFERWTEICLIRKQTPILIRLGSTNSIEEEASALFSQYGDVNLSSSGTLDILYQGGFIILLDGFNESKNPVAIYDFIRRNLRSNLILISSQPMSIPAAWSKELYLQEIQLGAFGKKELSEIMDDGLIGRLMSSTYLNDLVRLPYTALLIAKHTQNYGFPRLRLDIYRSMLLPLHIEDHQNYIPRLESLAWSLFKNQDFLFQYGEGLPEQFCERSRQAGILRKTGDFYSFTHDGYSGANRASVPATRAGNSGNLSHRQRGAIRSIPVK